MSNYRQTMVKTTAMTSTECSLPSATAGGDISGRGGVNEKLLEQPPSPPHPPKAKSKVGRNSAGRTNNKRKSIGDSNGSSQDVPREVMKNVGIRRSKRLSNQGTPATSDAAEEIAAKRTRKTNEFEVPSVSKSLIDLPNCNKNGRPSRLTKNETMPSPVLKNTSASRTAGPETPRIHGSVVRSPANKSVISVINSLLTAAAAASSAVELTFPRSEEKVAGESPVPQRASSSSLVSSMSTEDIQRHIHSLMMSSNSGSTEGKKYINLSGRRLVMKCLPIIIKLIYETKDGWIFKKPVDPVENCAPDYFEVIQHPMDLGSIKKKLEDGSYNDLFSFENDVNLVFDNCILYNGENSDLGEVALELKNQFSVDFQAVIKALNTDGKHNYQRGKICALCLGPSKQFEPAVLYCRGDCGGKRIFRNAPYYTDTQRQTHCWCTSCYDKLKESDPIFIDEGVVIHKKKLLQMKNDSLAEEEWTECSRCKRWIHQICGLVYNCGRMDRSASSAFLCPMCVIQERKDNKLTSSKLTSSGTRCQVVDIIPHCVMSEAIENGLHRALQKLYEKKAKERGISLEKVEKANNLFVRVVNDSKQTHAVREEMFERYKKCGYPREFTLRTKCILLFQTIHGVDVLLFGLYVYEYDHNCPPPNRRRVYISYLDSVNFFQPAEYRTFTYHTILIEYLRYVKKRGFHTAHIWACPAWDGDDFIFHIHPPHQKTSREDILCNWYQAMLATAEAEGVVIKTKTLYDEYFKTDKEKVYIDPTCLPYFDSDYIPGEIESIIKDFKEQELCKQKEKGDNSRMMTIEEKPGENNKRSTRSNPGDLMVHIEPDIVMKRLGHSLSQIKRNFFVVYLRSRAFAEAVDKGEDVSMWAEEVDEEFKDKAVNGVVKDTKCVDCCADLSADGTATSDSLLAPITAKLPHTGNTNPRSAPVDLGHHITSAVGAENKSSQVVQTFIGSTIDVDPIINNEIFETRQQFLNFCRSNHYQFDELRRAKHSSMMILYQIHSASLAYKFLHDACGECEIIDGTCCNSCFQSNEKRKENIQELLARLKNGYPNLCSRVISLLSPTMQREYGRDETNYISHYNDNLRERNSRIHQKQQQQMEERRRRTLNKRLHREYPSSG